jgi:hypothetical protein
MPDESRTEMLSRFFGSSELLREVGTESARCARCVTPQPSRRTIPVPDQPARDGVLANLAADPITDDELRRRTPARLVLVEAMEVVSRCAFTAVIPPRLQLRVLS